MFTGLVEVLGTVRHLLPAEAGRELVIAAPGLAREVVLGESVAVNGACLTVVQPETREAGAEVCRFQVGPETLNRTNLGQLKPGDRVNLERSLRMGDRLGGHLVQGHIDGPGQISRRLVDGKWVTMWFRCSPELTAQMVSKGSIAVDGISLTLVDVTREEFSVALIPHTLALTTLGFKGPGDTVNLETDLLAKYVAKAVQAFSHSPIG
jgi:riboflavin synthase